MNPKITVTVEGEEINERAVQQALERVGDQVRPLETTRGIREGAKKVLSWVLEFTGSAAKVAGTLTDLAVQQLAGAKVKVQIGTMSIEVSNATRSQLITILDKAVEIAKAAKDL